ncbi:general odorant-binding protein 56d-like [Wyeomyia smithii]|uniref:general odorant-binding protein 56d-like n=1 Tax=Wyeomyia smithii TaxID=174621 RepID=UPI002467B591|nr:general odorant-binding protein 56d-like [Wyeomyia smithii]
MKSVICLALLVVAVAALTEKQLKKADGFANECLVKFSGLSKDTLSKLRSGQFSDSNQDVKCFFKCFLQRAGFMDSKGILQTDYAIERLSQDREKSKVEALVMQCSQTKEDPCETAYQAFECYYNGKQQLI